MHSYQLHPSNITINHVLPNTWFFGYIFVIFVTDSMGLFNALVRGEFLYCKISSLETRNIPQALRNDVKHILIY